jgi:hypothetical protein
LTVSSLSAITAPFQIALGILSQTPFKSNDWVAYLDGKRAAGIHAVGDARPMNLEPDCAVE